MEELRPNYICRPYRGVSVQSLPVPIEQQAVEAYLLGRRVYRRTEFMVAEHRGRRALIGVERQEDGDGLFRPVQTVRWLAGPDEVAYVRAPDVDTGNATQMARAAAATTVGAGRPPRVVIVEGRYQHINFIVEPRPIAVRVVEVVPPWPPKLLDLAKRVIDYDEELDPIELELVTIDLHRLAGRAQATRWLLPCRCAGLELEGSVDFLDSGPPAVRVWTLIGCERSRQIHVELYGAEPAARVEMCPDRLDAERERPTLAKCCLHERGIAVDGARAVVPWGASLEEVRGALHRIVAVARQGEAVAV